MWVLGLGAVKPSARLDRKVLGGLGTLIAAPLSGDVAERLDRPMARLVAL